MGLRVAPKVAPRAEDVGREGRLSCSYADRRADTLVTP